MLCGENLGFSAKKVVFSVAEDSSFSSLKAFHNDSWFGYNHIMSQTVATKKDLRKWAFQ
jgi:hypothetical protein